MVLSGISHISMALDPHVARGHQAGMAQVQSTQGLSSVPRGSSAVIISDLEDVCAFS